MSTSPDPIEEMDFEYEDTSCPNCGGEGFVAHCWEEYACIDPEGGCDDCLEPCDWCNPPPGRTAPPQEPTP